jgi:hypothetical protein
MKNPSQSVCSFVKPNPRTSLASLLAVLVLCSLMAPALPAVESFKSGQGWATLNLGAGQVDRSTSSFSDNSTRFYLGNLQDGTKGSGLSQALAVARIYPQADSAFHVQLGAGSLTGWDNSPAGTRHHGTGWELGLGYDRMISPHGAITPFVRYTNGKAGNLKLSAVTVGVGYSWR